MLTHKGTQTIETERLVLRKFEYADTTSMIKNWVADEVVQTYYCEPVYKTESEVKELLERYIGAYENTNTYRWTITLKETGESIGQIAYFLVDEKNHFAEMEYCVGAAFQGTGLATEAARAVVAFGFTEMNLHKVQICHMPHNPASRRVIEKCGLKFEGTSRDHFYSNGLYTDAMYVDRMYYSILRHEFEELDYYV